MSVVANSLSIESLIVNDLTGSSSHEVHHSSDTQCPRGQKFVLLSLKTFKSLSPDCRTWFLNFPEEIIHS